MSWRPALRGLLDLLAPLRCPGCDRPLAPDERAWCAACEPLLEPVRARDPDRLAVYEYGGPIAEAIQRLKFRGRRDVVARLAAPMADRALALAGAVDRVVPVPLHPRRLRARGFDQASLLARPVARALGLPLDTGTLRRVRATRPQSTLDRGARLGNVRGAFACRRPARGRVLLLDDVRTTGATLAEASGALLRAGATEVRTLVLARVVG